jgi:hypothetical protein
MLKKAPPGAVTRRATYTVFKALREKYPTESGDARVAMAGRAATLLEAWLEGQKDVEWSLKYLLGQVLFDAQRFGDAAAAYESARDLAPDDKKQQITLVAAESQYRESQLPGMDRTQQHEILQKVRDLFTDVLVPPDPKDPQKAEQKKVLAEMANPAGWPRPETFAKVKRNPKALYVAALVYSQSSPTGMDGRYLALRLIKHLHDFTIATPDPDKATLHEFIPIWWDAAELKVRVYLSIAQSGSGEREKEARDQGHAYVKSLLFQYQNMDGSQRVATMKSLETQLRK